MLNVLPEQPTARRLLSYILQLAGRVSDSVIVQVLRRWLTERDRAVAANEDEWTALSRAVLRVLGLTPTDLPGERSGNPVSAFDAVRSLGLLGELSHSADLPASQLSSPGAVVTTPDHFQLFNALHLLLQDWSLAAQLEQQDAPLLAQVLSRMASGLGLGKHAAWYHAVYGTAHVPVAPSAATLALPTADADQALPPALTPTDPCFDIWAWLEARCAGTENWGFFFSMCLAF